MTHAVEKIEEKREDLESLTRSDLPVAQIAETLLDIAEAEE